MITEAAAANKSPSTMPNCTEMRLVRSIEMRQRFGASEPGLTSRNIMVRPIAKAAPIVNAVESESVVASRNSK